MTQSTGNLNQWIDPAVLARLSNLQLIAKTVVEGFLTGLHRSPFHGFSVEFAEFRQYTPGDDIRGIDWNVFARTDRYYIKKYEGETNASVHFLLDVSGSMGYASGRLTKLEYAAYLVASLAYFASLQRDAVGLMTFDEKTVEYLPARTRAGHLLSLFRILENSRPSQSTDFKKPLEHLAQLVRRKGVVVFISDFYCDLQEMMRQVQFFRFRGNDVILFHVLDPFEIEFPFDKIAVLEDMETRRDLLVLPRVSRDEYLRRFGEHLETLKKLCHQSDLDYQLLDTSQPLDVALARYLHLRQQTK